MVFSILNNLFNFTNIGEPRTLPPSSSQCFESSNISINVPVLYGIFSIGLALVLGVGAAIDRKIISQAIDKYKENNKA